VPTRPSWYVGTLAIPGGMRGAPCQRCLRVLVHIPKRKGSAQLPQGAPLMPSRFGRRSASVAATGSAAMRLVGPRGKVTRECRVKQAPGD